MVLMSRYVVLQKKDLDKFIERLASKRKVMAPVAQGYKNYAFEEVKKASQISLQYIPTILPPKKYFMPQRETIQRFDKGKCVWEAVVNGSEEMVLFGVHTCDLAGIKFLNKVMGSDPKDANYLARQGKIAVIGYECNDYCDEFASCAVMGNHVPNGGYDLLLTELDGTFLVHVDSKAGEKIVKETGVFSDAGENEKNQLDVLRKKKEKIFKPEVNVTRDELKPLFEKSFGSVVWEDLNKRCVACNNCTTVCPTCYCFDIKDDLDLNLTTGCRTRVWDGCQTEDFAKVAGGENFREKRGHRQRHRYNRKFNYSIDQYDVYSCTGCGRCTRACMANISLKETINELAKGSK